MKPKTGISLYTILLSVLLLLSTTAFLFSKPGIQLNHKLLDMLFLMRGPESPPDGIIIVAIDEPSFSLVGLQWPWPRGLHAELIRSLKRAGAHTVALDILFAEPSDKEQDTELATVISAADNVLLASDFQTIQEKSYSQEMLVKPLSQFMANPPSHGYANIPLDDDGTIRRAQLVRDKEYSFSHVASLKYTKNECCKNLDAQKNLLINFSGPARNIKTVSYYQALMPEDYLPKDIFKDKLVFVGLAVQSAVDADSSRPDYFPVPFSKDGGGYMAGVEIQANIAANLIHGNHLEEFNHLYSIGIGIAVSLILLLSFCTQKIILNIILLTLFLIGTALTCLFAFVGYGTFIRGLDLALPPVLLFGLTTITQYYKVIKERLFIRNLFSTYLAPEIVHELEQNPELLELRGYEVDASIMFLDIAGFTSLSEKLTPTKLLDMLNRILTEVSEIIINNNGLVDKYIGDAVMAVWGTPMTDPHHALHACQAALAVSQSIDEINESGILPCPIDFRVGINTGNVVAGNVGGEKHRNYTVLGDGVNLASRLEGVNKAYGSRIIINETTFAAIDDKNLITRELDLVAVKGKEQPVAIYELYSLKPDEAVKSMFQQFEQALNYYKACEWNQATKILEGILNDHPEDGPSKVMIERIRELKETPPPENWDGVYVMKTK